MKPEDAELMFKVTNLTLRSLNGNLDAEGMKRLGELIVQNPLAAEYYMEALCIHVGLSSMGGVFCLHEVSGQILDQNLWRLMLENEKTAPAVEVQKEKPHREPIQKVVYPSTQKRPSKWVKLGVVISSIAAILLFDVLLRFALVENNEFATLIDCVNTSWDDHSTPLEAGAVLNSEGGEYWLQGGFAKLLFRKGAEVVIEAPAHFEVLSGSELNLLSGRGYARMLKPATEFTVYTPNSYVIDRGTEFGVEVGTNESQVHVIKGKVVLVPEGNRQIRRQIQLEAGTAKKVDKSGLVKDILLSSQGFVSNISSKKGFIYRGERAIPISEWQAQLQIDPVADLKTNGRLIQAVNLGPGAGSVNIRGILFQPNLEPNHVVGGRGVELTGERFYSGPDKNVQGLLKKSLRLSEQGNTQIQLILNRQEVGKLYRIQLMVGFEWQWCHLNCYGVNQEYKYFPNHGKAGLGLVTYTWRSQSSTETITLTSPTDGPNSVHIFGYVLHELGQEQEAVDHHHPLRALAAFGRSDALAPFLPGQNCRPQRPRTFRPIGPERPARPGARHLALPSREAASSRSKGWDTVWADRPTGLRSAGSRGFLQRPCGCRPKVCRRVWISRVWAAAVRSFAIVHPSVSSVVWPSLAP